jgi:hypothetical protein
MLIAKRLSSAAMIPAIAASSRASHDRYARYAGIYGGPDIGARNRKSDSVTPGMVLDCAKFTIIGFALASRFPIADRSPTPFTDDG